MRHITTPMAHSKKYYVFFLYLPWCAVNLSSLDSRSPLGLTCQVVRICESRAIFMLALNWSKQYVKQPMNSSSWFPAPNISNLKVEVMLSSKISFRITCRMSCNYCRIFVTLCFSHFYIQLSTFILIVSRRSFTTCTKIFFYSNW